MIVGDLKELQEVASSIAGYRKVLVLGCGGCVTVCRTGGDAEAADLARRLSHIELYRGMPPEFTVDSLERQCEKDLIQAFLRIPDKTEAVVSLACGVGVQIVADVLEPVPVLPAVTTTFMGGSDEPGVWREKCRGCGDCLLASTAGICPIALCAKRLLNGPCGGSRGGYCEVGSETPCAWAAIHDRLAKQGRSELMDEFRGFRDWRKAGARTARERRRTGIE
ncbi:MAG: methylenetetrahydrofolate reductase C-terminal domain-containing protein [Acidobacteriota bacterium]